MRARARDENRVPAIPAISFTGIGGNIDEAAKTNESTEMMDGRGKSGGARADTTKNKAQLNGQTKDTGN